MRDSTLRLQDKTVLVTGPFNGTTQAIIRTLTEYGCDVGFVCDQPGYAAKFVEGVSEAREAKPEYGRAAHLALPLKTDKQIQEAMGTIVQSLGRLDALIDASPLTWDASTDPALTTELSMNLAEKMIPFFLAKQKGRVIFVFEDPALDSLSPSPAANGCRERLLATIESLAKKYRDKNVTVNGLACGVTDDFLLKVFPKSTSLKKSMVELQTQAADGPPLKLLEFHEIGMSCAYLASALSSSVTGQVLRLTHGFHI